MVRVTQLRRNSATGVKHAEPQHPGTMGDEKSVTSARVTLLFEETVKKSEVLGSYRFETQHEANYLSVAKSTIYAEAILTCGKVLHPLAFQMSPGKQKAQRHLVAHIVSWNWHQGRCGSERTGTTGSTYPLMNKVKLMRTNLYSLS